MKRSPLESLIDLLMENCTIVFRSININYNYYLHQNKDSSLNLGRNWAKLQVLSIRSLIKVEHFHSTSTDLWRAELESTRLSCSSKSMRNKAGQFYKTKHNLDHKQQFTSPLASPRRHDKSYGVVSKHSH